MQPETEDSIIELKAHDIGKSDPRSLALYAEYKKRDITEIIEERRENFERMNPKTKEELLRRVEKELIAFRIWLEKTKCINPHTAYYYSISLKSLLMGLPIGICVASLFDAILNIQ